MKRVCSQKVRNEFARLIILNNQSLAIGQIEGKCVSGTMNIDSTSYIRRSGTIKLLLNHTILPQQGTYLWTNNKLKLQLGIYDILKDNIQWFDMGVFLYKSTQMNYSTTDKTIDITLLDKMCKFDGTLGGTLENDIVITNKDVPISTAIRSLVTQIGGENPNNVLIDEYTDDSTGNVLTTPYTITGNAGEPVLNSIKTLTELYKYHTSYYNEMGIFVSEHTKTLLNDMISVDFKNDIDYTITSQVTNNFDYIKNYVKVYGISVQPTVSVEDTQSVNNQNSINSSTALKIIFNKPLYDSNGNRFTNNKNVKSFFQYNGNSNSFVSATYNSDDYSVIFSINGENGKILKPISNMIFDSCQIPFDDGGYVYSNINGKWSRILIGSLTTDGINNQTQFQLYFNKALYKNGSAINSGTSLKSSFFYADGSGNSNNFIDAIYVIDGDTYCIKLSFNSAITNATIQINQNGMSNPNSIYDNTGLIYRSENYIMSGLTWEMVVDDSSLVNTSQITAEASNTDDVNSPYSINNLQEKRVLVINDTNIFNKTQAQNRANYELQIHSNLNEQIVLSTLPLYFIDVNQLIYLYQPDLNINGKYRIDKISFDLKGSAMQITAVKVYM